MYSVEKMSEILRCIKTPIKKDGWLVFFDYNLTLRFARRVNGYSKISHLFLDNLPFDNINIDDKSLGCEAEVIYDYNNNTLYIR